MLWCFWANTPSSASRAVIFFTPTSFFLKLSHYLLTMQWRRDKQLFQRPHFEKYEAFTLMKQKLDLKAGQEKD